MSQVTQLEPRISIISLFVADLHRAYRFYAEGLGFPTTRNPEDDNWIGFQLNGICFCLYPYEDMKSEKLDRRLEIDRALDRTVIPGIGLAYNTREKHQVVEVLKLAEQAGGTIEEVAEETSWGGFSGYFADPDGHLWEVAWSESWEFNPDGSLVVT